jgi:hypothetical protein
LVEVEQEDQRTDDRLFEFQRASSAGPAPAIVAAQPSARPLPSGSGVEVPGALPVSAAPTYPPMAGSTTHQTDGLYRDNSGLSGRVTQITPPCRSSAISAQGFTESGRRPCCRPLRSRPMAPAPHHLRLGLLRRDRYKVIGRIGGCQGAAGAR